MSKVKITLDGWHCDRCGHQWVPRYYYSADRSMVPPKVCPRCKSPYWNTLPKKRRTSPPASGRAAGEE